MDRDGKEIEIDHAHHAHHAPLTRLRTRFGLSALPTPVASTPPSVAAAPDLEGPSSDLAVHKSSVSPAQPDPFAELQRELDALMDVPWANDWAERLRTARYADLDSVRRTTRMMLDLAAERLRAGDMAGFQSWRQYIIRHARGEVWDEAASRMPVGQPFLIGPLTGNPIL